MKYGVIDIGSNSVRLMLSDGKDTLFKRVKITGLAEGMAEDKIIKEQPLKRTAEAVTYFVKAAQDEGAEKLYVFATAAVRQAKNREEFLSAVKNSCGVVVDVVSGETEAELGLKGALGNGDGCVVDVGGASTEVIVVAGKRKVFGKSLEIGAVKIKDLCGQDRGKAKEYIESVISSYGVIPKSKVYCIGGTATSIAAILQGLEPYDPLKVDGYEFSVKELELLVDELYKMTPEERKSVKGLQPERAEIIAGGAALLLSVAEKIGVEKLHVSERDNLEGYLLLKSEKI